MRKSTFIFFLIFSLATFGCFASIAKRDFGFLILSLGCLFFALAFLVEVVRSRHISESKALKIVTAVELACLTGLSLLFFCKVFLFLFLGIDTIYLGVVIVLVAVLSLRIWSEVNPSDSTGASKNFIRILAYTALVVLLVSDGYSKIRYTYLTWLILAGLLLAVASLLFAAWHRIQSWIAKKEAVDYLNIRTNKSFWLLFGYLLFFSYSLMVKFNLTDEVYFKRLPRDYVNLFYKAESGMEEPVDGRYQFQIYSEGRDKFIDGYQADK